MKRTFFAVAALVAVLCIFPQASGQAAASKAIPAHAKVFIAPMPDGFDEFLKAAIQNKKVPIQLVTDKSQADFQITGQSETQKASTAKKVIMWDWRSNEQASIQVTNLASSEVVFAYSVNKVSSAHGKKSSAEACAKHLKEKIENQK
jgi:hypothetical protein